VARRTHALRLKLQATRLGQQPHEALKTARLLAKHQGFSKVAAQGLLRSLAAESLATAHDTDQLRRIWMQFDNADRRDPVVAANAATRAAELGAPEEGRVWLRPFWDRLDEMTADDRAAVAYGLVAALPGIGPDWLQRLEAAAQAFPRESAIALAVGSALAERRLWGKARVLLETAAGDADLAVAQRRQAWLALARLAEEEGDHERAVQCFEAAARLG
jgi:HemY protein